MTTSPETQKMPESPEFNLEALVKAQFYRMSLNLKTVLTLEECAEYTGLAKSYLYKLTHSRQIPYFKPNGKKIFFKREEVDSWLLSNKVETVNSFDELAMQKAFELNALIKPR